MGKFMIFSDANANLLDVKSGTSKQGTIIFNFSEILINSNTHFDFLELR
jgi:hypothetical protein